MLRKIALMGYYGAGNLGDELLLQSTIELIKNVGQFELIIFSGTPNQTAQTYPDHKIVDKFNLFEVLGSLLECDVLVFGGGSVFQDVSSLKSLFYYFAVCFCSKLFGKKLLLLGQGIGPLKRQVSNMLAGWAFKLADQVTVRDIESKHIADYWGLNAKLAADLVWALDKPIETPLTNPKSIVVSLRPSRDLTEETIKTIADFLNLNYSDYQINLIALQSCDLQVLNKLLKDLKNAKVFEIYNLVSWEQTGILFSNAEKCFCMRLHAIVLAIKCGTPSLGLAYDPKVGTLCKAAGLPFIKIDTITLDNLSDLNKIALPVIDELVEFTNQQRQLSAEVNSKAICALIEELD
jgi:polysaccharide pyruvyl transferase CsaB